MAMDASVQAGQTPLSAAERSHFKRLGEAQSAFGPSTQTPAPRTLADAIRECAAIERAFHAICPGKEWAPDGDLQEHLAYHRRLHEPKRHQP